MDGDNKGGNSETDVVGRRAQRKRKMQPKQRIPEQEESRKISYLSRRKLERKDFARTTSSDFDCPLPLKRTYQNRSFLAQNEEDWKKLRDRFPPVVNYKGKPMKTTDVVNKVINEVVQRVVREVALDIVNELVDGVVGKAVDDIVIDVVDEVVDKVKLPETLSDEEKCTCDSEYHSSS